MNASTQLSMFEPEGAEAVRLLQAKVRERDRCFADAERLQLLGLYSAAALLHRMGDSFQQEALIFALLLDIEREAGL
jgi:hypothetical protein